MKKLGVSLVAVLVGLPMMAQAAVQSPADVTVDTTKHVAATSFVQGAYNALAGVARDHATQIDANTTAIAGKQAQLKNDAGSPANISDTVKTSVATTGASDTALVTEKAVRDAIDASGSAVKGVQVNGSDLTPDSTTGKVNVTVAEGATNGTVAVNGADVAVHGLGSAAYTASTAYATAAQGALADSAVQSVTTGDSTSGNGTIKVDGTAVSVYGLGSAAYENANAFDASGTAAGLVGDLTTLTTTDKSNVVSAINEVKGTAGFAGTASELTDSHFQSTDKTSAAKAANAAMAAAAAAQTDATTANTSIGTLSSLTTTDKTDVVSAINEVKGSVDTLGTKQVEVYTTWNTTTTGKANALVNPDSGS